MRPSLASFAVLVALSAALSSCTTDNEPGQACTDPSVCGPAATIQLDLPLSFDKLVTSTITICRNDSCLAGSFASLNAPPRPNTGVPVAIVSTVDGGPTSGATALVRATMDGTLWLQVFWPTTLGGDPVDGDKYAVTVADGTGTNVLVFADTAVKYDVVQPLGKDCPTICRHIEFDRHTS